MTTTQTHRTEQKRYPGMPARRVAQLIFTIVAASCATTHAQSWETAEDVATVGTASASSSDALGNIFVAGMIREEFTGPSHAVILKSSDGGQSWDADPSTPDYDEPVDAFSVDGMRPIYSDMATRRVANEGGGFSDHLVAVGNGSRQVSQQLGPFNSNWFLRRSVDGGATWQMIDEYEHPTYENVSGEKAVALDSLGNIYAVGLALEHVTTTKAKTTTTTKIDHWLIRKGTNQVDGTIAWQTIDLVFPSTVQGNYGTVFPRGIACVGNDVYVVGGGGSDGGSWRVIKSSDGGASWTIADDYRLDLSDSSHARAITADNEGNLYVAGTAGQTVTTGRGKTATTTTTQYWVVRKAAPGGNAWETIDTFKYPGGSATPVKVAVDPFGGVHVTGSGRASSTPTRWVTRQGAGGVWTTSDDFAYADDGGSTSAKSICADPFGNVFAVGGSYQPVNGNPRNWLVRRKLGQ